MTQPSDDYMNPNLHRIHLTKRQQEEIAKLHTDAIRDRLLENGWKIYQDRSTDPEFPALVFEHHHPYAFGRLLLTKSPADYVEITSRLLIISANIRDITIDELIDEIHYIQRWSSAMQEEDPVFSPGMICPYCEGYGYGCNEDQDGYFHHCEETSAERVHDCCDTGDHRFPCPACQGSGTINSPILLDIINVMSHVERFKTQNTRELLNAASSIQDDVIDPLYLVLKEVSDLLVHRRMG
jgi:hypothetical protein